MCLGRNEGDRKDGKKVWPEGVMSLMEALRAADQQGRRICNGDHEGSSRKVKGGRMYRDRERDRRGRIDETPPDDNGRISMRRRRSVKLT
ncbi:hypothetical protein B0T13DRAFT_478387 [Neurospora crassa]|nr:hypothetical protein B0T13DRAFT_478387 [Neurospora crassa]